MRARVCVCVCVCVCVRSSTENRTRMPKISGHKFRDVLLVKNRLLNAVRNDCLEIVHIAQQV
jgi:hypothetical protein